MVFIVYFGDYLSKKKTILVVNSSRGISLGIRPVWRHHSLTLHPLLNKSYHRIEIACTALFCEDDLIKTYEQMEAQNC